MIRGNEPATTTGTVTLLGVASAHGDDAIGWTILRGWNPPHAVGCARIAVQLLRNPLEILDYLEPEAQVVIVDACQPDKVHVPGRARLVRWPDPAFSNPDATLSHGLDVVAVLRLAEALGRLPRSLWLFAVEVAACEPAQPLSQDLADHLPALRCQLAEFVDKIQLETRSTDSQVVL